MAKQRKLIDEYSYKIVLQQLAENEYLSVNTSEFNFKSFSNEKTLFEYQAKALENAFRVLLKFYNDYNANKNEFYNKEYKKYPHSNLDYLKPNDLLQEYFELLGKRIEFYHFVNRMSFWMTMGSGKTIVIIKLIELLDKAIEFGLIPKKNILFFTANEGLLDRFKKEVDEYNLLKEKSIDTISLKDYEDRQRFGSVFDSQVIKLFCYRADLISDERKEATLDFKDYLDDGNNYVILDEAHKGDKQDSKRQNIFSILAKNGFLFNFSATFTDESDIATTIYNLNQAVWVKKGYGKKLFLLDNDLKAFKEKTDLNENEKQQATLKSLLLLALAKKYKLSNAYHDPMMVVFTNSVNTVEADAELFFKTLQSIAKDDLEAIFNEAIKDLKREFKDTKYLVTDKDGEGVSEFAEQVAKISFNELKELVFYAKNGNIEAIVNPKDKTEIAFKLDSADKPFCLIKIGDISSWLKEKLKNIKIDETFKEESYFKSLDDSSINILLGSRAFYEGWDTTRPNIMLFLNIGMDKEAKKFVTQSIGRGMRVESVNGSRQRIDFIDTDRKAQISKNAKTLETLFIVSTNKEAIESIISWQEEQNKGIDWHEVTLKRDEINNKILYIPIYKEHKISADKISSKKAFKLSDKNKEDLKIYINNLTPQMFALKHKLYNKKEYDLFAQMIKKDDAFFIDKNTHYKSLDTLIQKLTNKLYIKQSVVDTFKALNDEIIHFRKIKVREDKKAKFEETVLKVIKMQNLTDEEVTQKAKEDGISLKEAIDLYQTTDIYFNNAKFQKILNHYYNPVISGVDLDWIKNIISEESEVVFLEKLTEICRDIDKKYDWWMFSKISQYHDKDIYIPYTEDGEEKQFYPDFIFWLQKDNKQTILFIDPKGDRFGDYQHKIDGYNEVFLNKNFNIEKTQIDVKLALVRITNTTAGKEYEHYWFLKDNLLSIFD
ncbi:DEAD/DEAH box helicase family protein [Campylobacter sp. faydin G-24]|uniref:DEAD/DEAH box helicase family protein n=1 Tax=Campylobacter anatolicus TaxID=2829105 RepID=A0ABS5HGV3_9BACT|nr:DEAD/DEAH box helicase family protein [Campylobacter anatolicus]MBR8463506.1 DEAD/DEAH box helicase family protein [Campylobacter anatolicus]